MRIVIFSINFYPELTATGFYSGEFSKDMSKRGHDVVVFAAYPFYPEWKLRESYPNWRWSIEKWQGITIYRCPTYIPRSLTGVTRLMHYGSFAISSFFAAMIYAVKGRPELVMNVAPTLMSSIPALLLSWFKRSKSWLHVQDFEVEAGIVTGQMDKGGLLGRLAMRFEASMIAKFDRTSSISPEMCRKLQQKGRHVQDITEFRNWSDSVSVTPKAYSNFRKKWNITSSYVALYSGSITRKQGIELIVEAARLLAIRRDITLIICGNGPNRKNLETLADGLANIRFYDLQPFDALSDLLALATVHLLPQKADAADLVLPSKLANILASGRPVIAGTNRNTGLAREVAGHGLVIEPENAVVLAESIASICDDVEMRNILGTAARKRAEEYWNREKIIDEVEREMSILAQNIKQ